MSWEKATAAVPHPVLRRYWAEDLVRLRRADEDRRYAASQRRGRIDPNPHQIDAVMFALRRLGAGEGCILADEVGLGKTIEAGLVIAQRLAEGARRILLVLPKPLLGQWANELHDLFGIKTREGGVGAGELFVGEGVFVIGREFAGSERGAAQLQAADPFDLCVIDEAHEIFAGVYKRFDRRGSYDEESDAAVMAHRVRSFLRQIPVLLLTATPIQNTLTELWGLVQYVEPTGTLLGNITTFRELFCEPGGNDRVLVPAQAGELRRRINLVCQRTLRRQAQEFLEKPFTKRRAQLFEYQMSPAEKSLYDDVTDYLLEPNLCAFRGAQRLLLIGFLRRMASSLRALAASLSGVANRLRRMLHGEQVDLAAEAREFARDIEDDELPGLESPSDNVSSDAEPAAPQLDRVRAELQRVEDFVGRANSLASDAKVKRLIDAVRLVIERGRQRSGSGKLVIFTEFLTTQDYLRQTLAESDIGLGTGDITLFRGDNDSPRDREALERWQAEVGSNMSPGRRPSRQIAVRLALIHEFRTRSRIFISTEAGAKGLNLQFCETLVNYDLPWNPQRIEQRIGRCHRYGQTQPVTVINFLASDNESQRLTFQILSEKLELFGQVLDASDAVLYQPETDAPELLATALGASFEAQLQRIHQRARSRDEITAELRKLSNTMSEERRRFEDVQQRTASLIESRFDESVRQVFRRIAEELPASLKRLDDDLERVVCGYLRARGIAYERREIGGRVLLVLAPSPELPPELRDGATLTIGHSKDLADVEPLHLGHALVHAAVAEARAATAQPCSVRVTLGDSPDAQMLAGYRGCRGRLVVTKAAYAGFEPVEHLLATAIVESDPEPLPAEATLALFSQALHDAPPFDPPLAVEPDELADAIDEAVFLDHKIVARDEQTRFHRMLEQIERYVDDQALVLRRRRLDLESNYRAAQEKRDAAVGAEARTKAETQLQELQGRIEELDSRIQKLLTRDDPDYQKWRDFAHRRRFGAPRTERILDVEFVID